MANSPVELEERVKQLAELGQTRLAHLIESGGTHARELAAQAASVDWRRVRDLFSQKDAPQEDVASAAARAVTPPGQRLAERTDEAALQELRKQGKALLAEGKVGVLIVAGGQGTRLGFDAPKGMYPIGPVSKATLFQILLEKVAAVGERYGITPPLYVMTSDATYGMTKDFLAAHDFFGLSAVNIFRQGNMPAVDAESGEALLSSADALAFSPDGHGGLPAALAASGCFADMRRRGIEHIFYLQVDNPLVAMCDPEFLGLHKTHGSEMSTQVVAKLSPTEKVGVVAQIDGKTRIIEYSDLPAEAANRRNADGSLALWAGNIAVHVIDVDFLERASSDHAALPFHIARKAVPYVNHEGALIKPTSPNALKFERFFFDLLPRAKNAIVMEVEPADAFVPLKNASGADRDSPEHVRAALSNQAKRWLQQAGAHAEEPLELSPLFALDQEALEGRNVRGQHFPAGTYLRK